MSKRVDEMLETWGKEKEPVPTYFSKGIDEVLNNLPKSNVKADYSQPKRMKWVGKSMIAAAAISFGIIGSGFVSPAMASVLKEVPLIGSIFGGSSDSTIQVIEEKGLATQLNETVTNNGVSVTINEAYLGGGRIVIAYTLETDKVELQNIEKASGVPLTFDAKLNGQQFDYMAEYEQKVENNKATGIIDIDYGLNYSLIDQPTLSLNMNEISGVKGSWNFELLLGNSATSEVTNGFAPNVTATWDDAKFVVERVEFTPVQSQIIVDRTLPEANIGNYHYNVFDENGTSLGPVGGSGSAITDVGNGLVNFKDTLLLPGYEEAPRALMIEIINNHGNSYDPTNYVEVNIPLNETKFPYTIDYPDGSKLIITGFEQLEDKTVLHYDIEGKLSLQNEYLTLFNKNGESINETSNPERTSLETLSFKREFNKTEGSVTLNLTKEKIKTTDWQIVHVDLKN